MAVAITETGILEEIDSFDFIDVGANKGNSFAFGIDQLGGTRGLALDINPKAVAKLRSLGIPALERDCRTFDFSGHHFRFAVFSHILEHMPDTGTVLQLLMGAARGVSDFIFVRQPFFDESAYLSTLGMKAVATNLSYHPLHLASERYAELLTAASFRDFAIYGSNRLEDSHASAKIVDTASPLGTKGWRRDPATKPAPVRFDRPIYQELAFFIKLGEVDLDEVVERALPERELLYKSRRHFRPLPD